MESSLPKKIPIQELKITVPPLSMKKSSPNDYWKNASKKKTLSVVYTKANIDAISDFNINCEIPFGVPAALLLAYKYHADVLLRPDDIWITICHGLAKHISINAETLRKHFVDHDGKKKLVILRPEPFDKMNWEAATGDFASLLQKEVKGDFSKVVECDFTTTTRIEHVASLVSLMSTMKHYFEYNMICGSGIRNVYMAGTLEDWKKLRAKTEAIAKYNLEWWTEKLLYIIDNFIATFEGKASLKFWNYMVDKVDGTGASGIRTKKSDFTGWLINFYPYTKDGYKVKDKIKPRDFPKTILKALVLLSQKVAKWLL
eukprot:TRINITY_DN1651_c0_g1_i2.p1 TRINITY_DN1651_c0_g1~~TRINITY_DN1651_c0_g1_i2.p1  ORF type:complete len:348 (-),score=37.90 TRINITY_DN1651_c0_g1_i2:321-1265(-)